MDNELFIIGGNSVTSDLVPDGRCYKQTCESKSLLNERYESVFIYNDCCKIPNTLNPNSVKPLIPVVNPPVETGLAVTLWVVAIICLLLIIFFCVIVLVGMAVMVCISFHQHISHQNLQQMQIKLLVTLSKCLRKKSHSHLQGVGNRKKYQKLRLPKNTTPFCHATHESNFFSSSISNSAFNPRNNTPVSSNFNLSFSSHASLSNSGPPSFSSVSPSFSEDSQNESQSSSGLTVVHPIREQVIQRANRDGIDEDRQGRKPVSCDFMRRREFQQLPHNWREQASEKYKWSSATPHMPQAFNSPREYWL